MKGGPSHQPHMISGSSRMRVDSDGEFDPVVSEEVDSCVETDGGSEETPACLDRGGSVTEATSSLGNQTSLDGKSSSRQMKVHVIGRDIHVHVHVCSHTVLTRY